MLQDFSRKVQKTIFKILAENFHYRTFLLDFEKALKSEPFCNSIGKLKKTMDPHCVSLSIQSKYPGVGEFLAVNAVSHRFAEFDKLKEAVDYAITSRSPFERERIDEMSTRFKDVFLDLLETEKALESESDTEMKVKF